MSQFASCVLFVFWAWIRAPATHFLGARILTTLPLSIPPAASSALPQHLPSPFSVIILSSQYLFQRGPIWVFITFVPFEEVRCFILLLHRKEGCRCRMTTPTWTDLCNIQIANIKHNYNVYNIHYKYKAYGNSFHPTNSNEYF